MKVIQPLQVEVRSRQGLVFSGELQAVSAYNKVGLFDVLSKHANFVSMITNKLILRRTDGRVDEINVEDGVMVVEDNTVKVFLGITKS
jgi:F0F1-type ATP synthase epsilon subunit